MLLYDAAMPAPHPRRVRMFLAEKGIDVPMRQLSLMEREHKQPDFIARNSLGQAPILELDDGTVIAESNSICRYLEELHPHPPLFGRTPIEIAHIDMWARRIEFQIKPPQAAFWVHAHPLTEAYTREQKIARFPEYGEDNRERYAQKLRWLDEEMRAHAWIAGDAFSMADIVAISVIDFGVFIGMPIPAECANVARWREAIYARPSANA